MKPTCASCDHCRISFKSNKTGRELVENNLPVFVDINARRIFCAKNCWQGPDGRSKEFTSMAVFEVSSLPKEMGSTCTLYENSGACK